MAVEFFQAERTAVTAFRMAVLLGANTRTYKFALAQSLLDIAATGNDLVSDEELAAKCVAALLVRGPERPQASTRNPFGPKDFLTALASEAKSASNLTTPSDHLTELGARTMLKMVLSKFHNLRGIGQVPYLFYTFESRGRFLYVRLSSEMMAIGTSKNVPMLLAENEARWGIVESSFDTEIGRGLLESGLVVADEGDLLVDPRRRIAVSNSRDALTGFQHGRYFYCAEQLAADDATPHVDHVIPFFLQARGIWKGPNLNGIWNLVVAHSRCNMRKTSAPPLASDLARLWQRNERIAWSPHPLKRAVENQCGKTADARRRYLDFVWSHLMDTYPPIKN